MKLSEAMRLGVGAVRESRGVYLKVKDGDACGCALGTAAYAVGMRRLDLCSDAELLRHFPILAENVRIEGSTTSLALHISMQHVTARMNRAELADFVETIEQQLEAQATPQLEVAHVTY